MLKKERAIELHRKLWDFLVKHPDLEKYDWDGWVKLEEEIDGWENPRFEGDWIINNCFLCEYLFQNGVECMEDGCLLEWSTDGSLCYNDGKLYTVWENIDPMDEDYIEKRRRFAKEIRDLKSVWKNK